MKKKMRFTPAQKKFLRTYRQNPAGPPPADWPSPLVFRRWLRKPDFRKAVESIRDALRFQADLHLASASATAARAVLSPDAPLDPKRHLDLLHLSHTRQRFATPVITGDDATETEDRPNPRPTGPVKSDRPLSERTISMLVDHWNNSQNDPTYLKGWIAHFCCGSNPAFLDFLLAWPDLHARYTQYAREEAEKAKSTPNPTPT